MPAVSEKQRQAAGAELARRRKGLKPQKFIGLSEADLREFASSVQPKRKKR